MGSAGTRRSGLGTDIPDLGGDGWARERPEVDRQGLVVTRKTGHPISVRHAALSAVSRGPTR